MTDLDLPRQRTAQPNADASDLNADAHAASNTTDGSPAGATAHAAVVPQAAAALDALFRPATVAVIGASRDAAKIGSRILSNIRSGGYPGAIYPINPRGGEIDGLPAYTDIAACPQPVELAVIAVPATHVAGVLRDCGRNGVPVAVIITSGFAETGNAEGERELMAIAAEYGIRIVGPNVFGVYSAGAQLNATFGPSEIERGGVAIVTQSGALGIAMIGKTCSEKLGLSAIVSVGNKADLAEADLLEWLVDDPLTRVVLLYVEGVRDGERLVRVLQHVTRRKPVVVIKAGRSQRGAAAAASHTGALAGADEVFDAIARQCGMIRATSIADALDWCGYLSAAPPPAGRDTVILTNGGGMGVLATDACDTAGLTLCDDLDLLRETFGGVVNELGSVKNPIDLTGTALPADYDRALDAALASDRIGSVICLGCETAVFDHAAFAEVVRRQSLAYAGRKPIVFSVVGGRIMEDAVHTLRRERIPIFPDTEPAVACLGALYRHHRHTAQPLPEPPAIDLDLPAIQAIVDAVHADGRRFLLAHESAALMTAAGVRTPQSAVARTLPAAVAAADRIGYPVVMKIVSRDIIHKSDVGGIALDLQNPREVMDAYESMLVVCRRHVPHAHIEGVEIGEQVRPSIETIVGARRDPAFGPVVMFGLGGIYVELLKDVTFRAYPLDRREALHMLASVRAYPLLLGARGDTRKDLDATADAILRIGRILREIPAITDIEVNPLIVYDAGDGAIAVDARILLTPPPTSAAPPAPATPPPAIAKSE